MSGMNRRTFLIGAAVAPLSGSPNDEIRVGVVGVRSRGRTHIDTFAKQEKCRVAAICEIDDAQAARALKLAGEVQPSVRPRVYKDIRRLLEDKEIDAISIAACNHWHALAAVWACQAGKDVYVEKPASHNIREGRKMVEAARKYKRIVQVGMQARSLQHYRKAIELVRGGAIGKVYLAKGLCFKRRKSIGRQSDTPVPPGVDYDLWLGPAPVRPFNPNRFHYNWHWFWDTGNGDIGNQGVCEMDIARWGLGKNTLPKKVHSTGGKFVYDDDQETPNTQLAVYEYDDCHLIFEVRGLLTGGESSIRYDGAHYIGNLFFGSEGHLSLDCFGFQMYLGEKHELAQEMKHVEPQPWDTAPHVANFLNAMRSRNESELANNIEDGHLSAALSHLANISYRTGRKLSFEPATETFGGDAEAGRYLTRDYRAPFVVPAKV